MATDAATTDGTNSTNNTPPPAETVPREEFVNVKNDMHKFKEENQKLMERLKAMETEKLRAAQDWQKIAEQNERDRIEVEGKYKGLQTAIISDKKMSAIKEAALKLGIRQDSLADLEFLPFDDVQVEMTTAGRVNILGAETAMTRLKTLRPHWFQDKNLNLNTNSPTTVTGDSGKVTMEELKKAELEAKKTGNYKKYQELLLKVKAQK